MTTRAVKANAVRAVAGRVRTLAVAAALVGGLLPALPAAAQYIPGAAARVNGVEISNFRLERHFEEYLRDQRRNITPMINPGVYKKYKREALDQLIEREVLWQAAKADGALATDAEVRDALKKLEAQLPNRADYLRRLERAGFDEKTYAQYLKQDLSVSKYLVRKTADLPAVSDDDVQAYYQANQHRFRRPETARARHILIKADATAPPEAAAAARARAEALRRELRGGADFAELARRHSGDPSAAEGGDLGDVARGRMVKAFDEALFALAPGQVSDVVATPAGFHLIKLESRAPEQLQPLADVREAIRARIANDRRAAFARDYLATLMAKARTEVLIPQ